MIGLINAIFGGFFFAAAILIICDSAIKRNKGEGGFGDFLLGVFVMITAFLWAFYKGTQ